MRKGFKKRLTVPAGIPLFDLDIEYRQSLNGKNTSCLLMKECIFPLSVEFFFNLKEADRYNDVIRISPGLGYKFNDEWKAEFYVSYHYE